MYLHMVCFKAYKKTPHRHDTNNIQNSIFTTLLSPLMLFNAIFTQQSRIIKFYSTAACIRLYRRWVIYGSSLWCGLVEGLSFMLFLISVPACQTYQPAGCVSSICMSQRWEVVREWRDRGETKSTSPIPCWICLCCQRV